MIENMENKNIKNQDFENEKIYSFYKSELKSFENEILFYSKDIERLLNKIKKVYDKTKKEWINWYPKIKSDNYSSKIDIINVSFWSLLNKIKETADKKDFKKLLNAIEKKLIEVEKWEITMDNFINIMVWEDGYLTQIKDNKMTIDYCLKYYLND